MVDGKIEAMDPIARLRGNNINRPLWTIISKNSEEGNEKIGE